MTVLDVLREARALYAANPSHTPANESPVDPEVCMVTATARASDDRTREHEADAILEAVAGTSALVEFNATHSTAEVLAVFDRAIALASPDGTDAG